MSVDTGMVTLLETILSIILYPCSPGFRNDPKTVGLCSSTGNIESMTNILYGKITNFKQTLIFKHVIRNQIINCRLLPCNWLVNSKVVLFVLSGLQGGQF